ncbi:terribly reduced optic lobes isoform X1 [Colletes latitarsis]|uniref:terribly reduced optic lobes isoform X1 n=1 Tax=Colletes latitarsis TaxID=2605962 RepID=UPI0040363344
MRDLVSPKSCLFLLLIAAASLANAFENDDLVFDQEVRQSSDETPTIVIHQEESFLHRIKRSVVDFFAPTTTTTETPPGQKEDVTKDELQNESPVELDDDIESRAANDKELANLKRLTRDSGEEKEEADEHNNEIGNAAESRRDPPKFGNTDDEDLAGSGEVEGSATEVTVHFDPPRIYGRYYRITLTVGEPYKPKYTIRNSREYKELSTNLTQALEELFVHHIPNQSHHANVVKITPTPDNFKSQVTLDIGTSFSNDLEVKNILVEHLQKYHSLGSIQVYPDELTFRAFPVMDKSNEQECDSTELPCRNGACVPLDSRCDGIPQCEDASDEIGCPETTPHVELVTETLFRQEGIDEGSDDNTDDNTLRPTLNKCRADDTVRCRDGSRDICSVQQCDGTPDCDDGADEEGCPHPGCSTGEFACDVSRCILDSQRCNFIEECQDGSDEHDCNYPACTPTQFKCKNNQCIDSSEHCNGVQDCHDGSDELNCPCREDQFECTPGYCVSLTKRCDRFMDCNGGADERDCENMTRCRPDEFECSSGDCVSQSARCDGRSDCLDRSDEFNCSVTTCSSDQFRCIDGTCLSMDKRCNHVADCRNGDDENQCGCGEAEFRCTDGRCIGYELQCNGMEECSDGSDERDCDLAPCPSSDFTCSDGSCIPESTVCDGFDNCPRAEDELHCERKCTPTQFKCLTGNKCIEGVYRCDGHPDCPDRSDEDCANETITHATQPTNQHWPGLPTKSPRECDPSREMRCDDGMCVLLRRKCDNVFDCLDGSDERGCGVCSPAEWKCASGECIAENERCDDTIHCVDGSDETGCVSECPAGMFRCDDGLCLNSKRRCDGQPHCLDGSDEINCHCPNGQLPCDNGICINSNFFCDNNVDCLDGSDERDCHDTGGGRVTDSIRCRQDEFTCRDGSCIPASAVCDGRQDCPHEDDESNCHRGCGKDQFQCTNGVCIRSEQKCNGYIDCDDGSDEHEDCGGKHPMPGRCPAGYIMCDSDKNCIPQSSMCDGVPDCRDRSDEQNCDTSKDASHLNLKTYPSEQVIKESREVVFQCRDESPLRARVRWVRGDGLPLPPGSRDTDGRLEMPNIQLDHAGIYICEAIGYPPSAIGRQVTVHLDVEKFDPPVTNRPICQYEEATCSNGDCIPKSYVCNGRLDCTDGSDEMRCSPHGCQPNEFRCNNTECVSKLWRCDGDQDCADRSDEENCAPSPPNSPCRYSEFECASGQCIPKVYQCDHEKDCLDGSDEIGCSGVYIVQPPPPMVQVVEGADLVLTCKAIGVPVPVINWRRNWGHVPIKCTMTSVNGTGTLTCLNIATEDEGAYSCEAINGGGFVFAVPDATVIVTRPDSICPKGTFNSEARTANECISCFCFGVATECHSANLFTYQIPPPFDRHKFVAVAQYPAIQLLGDIGSQTMDVRSIGRDGVQLSAMETLSNDVFGVRAEDRVTYFALPESYHGSQLKSYGGYLKYRVRYNGTGTPSSAPSVIISGNDYVLVHRGRQLVPSYDNEESVRFFQGEWYKQEGHHEIPASRGDIMMTLAQVENILIKARYDDSPHLDIRITNVVMDTADARNTGLGSASYVEECQCPSGYSGLSCQQCAPGFLRRESGPWLGQCYRDEQPCPPGYYGDPMRNIPCQVCPCPLTNPSNQFARTCHLGSDGQPTCDCPPGYVGRRCEQCDIGYTGNPLIPGNMCVHAGLCDPDGSHSVIADPNTGQCRCKQYATGLTCNQCKANTFNLASKNQFGCISCFCMGITNQCVSSNWYRNDIRVSFTNSVRDFTLIESKTPDAPPIADGIRVDTINREIVYKDFPSRGTNDVYYWQLPSIFLGDQVTSYGGNLQYTIRYVPSPGGHSSRNNAADVELISANDINLLYFSGKSPDPNTLQNFTVPLLEQYWQRNDGTQADREHMLMALADIRAIRIKATYTTHTDEAALSLASLDTAEKHNTGRNRAVEVEECSCPVGYKGLSCEDCDIGYTRTNEGLYLGVCEACNCNGHSRQCNPDTGTCERCEHHTTGDFCEVCESGYEGDATRGTPSDCVYRNPGPRTCNCNMAGSYSDACIGERCNCKRNVEGPECNRCRPSTFGLSAENPDGCNECYCSGVTDQCHESSLYVQQIPIWVYDTHHGFTLTDSTRHEVIDDDVFELNIAMNEIGYRYPDSRGRSLFWSLPTVFTGNKVKSYGGNLTLTQHITAYPGAQSYKDQDIILIGNGITLFWTNPTEIQPDVPLTYSVPLRESEWKRLSMEGLRVASRIDLMTVLSNLEAILVRASHSERMTATYISDISLDTAVEHVTGHKRAVQVEVCRCSPGYVGTSCESCARGYYRDISNRSVSYLGSCTPCPCNNNEESCDVSRTGQVKCHCQSGYTGQYCQDTGELMVSLTPMTGEVKPHTWTLFTCSYESTDPLYIYFKLSPFRDSPLTASSATPNPMVRSKTGASRTWHVYVQEDPCNVECYIQDPNGKDLIKVVTSVTPGYPVETTLPPNVHPPKIIVYIKGPEIQIVETGSTVRYHCSGRAVDNGSVHVKWEKEGGYLPPERSVDDNRGLLIIRDVIVSDSGIYVCQVSDGVHVALKNVTLTVGAFPKSLLEIPGAQPTAPRATVMPTSLQVIEGEFAEFRCEADGYPSPQIDWIRVHGPMNPEVIIDNGVWTLRAVSKNDEAEYKCIARNNVGIDEKTVVLYVKADNPNKPPPTGIAPVINPPEWTGSVGEVIRITCTQSQAANVTWSRSEYLPMPTTASQIDGVLTIMHPTQHDSGIYVCTATNFFGMETSSFINIMVMPRRPAPSVKVMPDMQTVPQGSTAEIRCVVNGEPGAQITWNKYLQQLNPNAEHIGDTLRIPNVQISDRGVYICRVTGPSGSHEASGIVEVEPREVPLLELYPKDPQTVILGGSVDLHCRAIAGIPTPQLHWSRQDGRPFLSNVKQLSGGVLRFTNITSTDSGAYVCSAANSVGSTSAVTYIEVQSMPEITISPTSGMLNVKRGELVRLVCSATGSPQPKVEWVRHVNGMMPYPEFRMVKDTPLSAVYEIASISDDDEGSYTCHAMNAAGIVEERVHIRIDDDNEVYPPCRGDVPCHRNPEHPGRYPDNDNRRDPNGEALIPVDESKIPIGGRVEMRCRVYASNGNDIRVDWRRSDHRRMPHGHTVHNGLLIIPDVDKSAAGEYICLGMDQTGNILFKAKSLLIVQSPPRIVLNPPRQTVGLGENPSIVCSATGDEPITIEWAAIGRSLPHGVPHNSSVLQFHGITYDDAGKYVCKAMNAAGTADAVAEVLVNENSYEDMRVQAAQKDVVAYVGNPVHLRCIARVQAEIHWSREGQPLPSNVRKGKDYLELPHVRPEDSGRYICQIQTPHGVSSDYINLNVSLVNLPPDCMRANQTQCGQKKCVCGDRGCILLDYSCYDIQYFNESSDYYYDILKSHYLQQRRATNVPRISVEVSQDPVNIGDTIAIRCDYSGTHTPRYHWSRANHPSLPANSQRHENILRLTDVTVDNSGYYTCTAETPEGIFKQDFNLVVHGGHNDEPAIETKYAPYGSSVEMNCRPNLDPPLKFQWSKLGGVLPRDTFESKLNLTNVKAEDAGTYICTVNNDLESIEIPTVLVVTGVVPYFSQAPESFIALPPLPDSYLKFNIEVSFKPESYDGIILYNDESNSEDGDFIMLSLVRGYPQFSFDLGSGPTVIHADEPVSLSEWHTIKLQRNRKEGTMLVDGDGPYKGVASGRRQGLDLKKLLFVGGVPNYNVINKHAEITTGFVGCISRLVIGNKEIDLNGNQANSIGITNCETCAENPCNNGGVCQEAATKNGYTCLCRAGYSGKYCDYVGQSCYPGACGEGNCVDKETGFECYCPYGKTGPRCENSMKIYEPAFHDDKSFIAHDTPKALRRLKVALNFNPLDNKDGILMYCSQSDEGLGDFVALVVKNRHVEFRYDIGSGLAIIRSSHVLQPGVWTHVSVNRDFKEGNLTVNGEPTVGGKSPGTARTMTLYTPLYIGGVDRRRITVNKHAGVDRTFRGCISDLGVSSMNVDILKSAIDSANIDDCNVLHPNQTKLATLVTTPPSTTTPYNPCTSNPCVHGMCQSTDSYDYSCTCEYGYVGRNCENILKQCELLLPCKNEGSCTDLHGSYKCDCRLGYNGQNCEKSAEITYDVAFTGDGWLELDRSVMNHNEERELIGFEISTNKTRGLIMWHGQSPNDLNPDHYMALGVVDGYVEYQYNLGTGPVKIRVTAQKVDDGERHRIILKRRGSDGSIELNGEHMENGASYGTEHDLNTRGNVYLGGVPDYAMTYGKYHEGFSGCIYTMEVQDSGAIDIGEKAIRGKNVSPCTSDLDDRLPTRGDLGTFQ